MPRRPGYKRGLGRAGVWTAAAALFALPLTASDSRAQEQDQLTREQAESQLEQRKRELDQARDREAALAQDLEKLKQERAALNEQLIAAAQRAQTSEAELSKIEGRLVELSGQERDLRGSLSERHAAIAKLLSAMQRMGREPPPAIVARRDDALKMVRSAMLLASVFPELRFQADGLSSELDDLTRLGDGIRQERDNIRAETERLEKERKGIRELLEQKKALMQHNQEEMKKIQEAAQRHAKEVVYLGDLLKRMNKELATTGLGKYEAELAARRKEEKAGGAAKDAAKDAGAAADTEKLAALSPGRIEPALPFEEAKEKLPLPVSGQRVRGFGEDDGYGGSVKGLSLRTRAGAQVTSPTDGWIVYAGEFRSYGQLLIINAGGGYHILLAGMTRIDVNVGQFVLAGEPVASMGAATAEDGQENEQAGPVFYVEFRKDGRPIDPDPWWAKGPEKVQG